MTTRWKSRGQGLLPRATQPWELSWNSFEPFSLACFAQYLTMKPEMNVAWVIGRDKKSPRPLACVIHFTVYWNLQVLCGYCVLSSLLVCQREIRATFSWRYEKFEIPPLFDKLRSWFPQLFENGIKMSCFSFIFSSFLSWLVLWASLPD